MDKRHFDYDPFTGTVETFYFDHANDTFTIQSSVDLEPLIEENKAFMSDAGSNWKGGMHRVATIPLVLLPELEKKGIMTRGGKILDHKKLRAWINDRDNLAFRTRPGVV